MTSRKYAFPSINDNNSKNKYAYKNIENITQYPENVTSK